MLRSFSSTLPHELRLLSALQPSRRPLSTRLSYPRLHGGHQQHLSLSAHLSLQSYRSSRALHLTPRRDIPIPAVLALLKSSTVLAGITTVSRIVVSFLPLPLLAHWISEKKLAGFDPKYRERKMKSFSRYASEDAWKLHASGEEIPKDASPSLVHDMERIKRWEQMKEPLEKWRVWTALAILAILGVPFFGYTAAFLAGLERTPITGRWRLILLSPSEEETLHDALSGTGWFDHVLRLLRPDPTSPPPQILSAGDWRWAWVESTLRALERGAEDAYRISMDTSLDLEAKERALASRLPFPPPPPPPFPLNPRPRVAQILHHTIPPSSNGASPSHSQAEYQHDQLLGPPFSLLLIDNPEANAFSYGFGDDRAAGIVVNSGILDEILRMTPGAAPREDPISAPPARRSWLSYLLPDLAGRQAPRPSSVQPSPEQTLHLASVLAHEVAHLLLTHHLESLSSRQVVLPSIFNLGVDLLRTFLFPFTWILGPFVNDGIAALSRTGETELSALSSNCSNQALEVEADLVGLRIMAHAGFNPYDAARFWLPDHAPTPSHGSSTTTWGSAWRSLSSGFGLSHPTNEVRSEAVKKELAGWQKVWEDSHRQPVD